MSTPTAFISYSWDNDDHKDWVKNLATRLRADGIDVTLDVWAVAPNTQLPAFMEKGISDNDFVLVICTPGYKERSDARRGGVGYEGHIITSEIFNRANHEKFIPVRRCGTWGDGKPTDAAAAWIGGGYYIDLTGNPYSEGKYEELVRTLYWQRETAPPLGEPMVVGPENSAEGQETESFDGQIPCHRPGTSRVAGLESELKWSISACKESFITLGVNADMAAELANDADVGRVLDLPEPGLHLLLGDQGSGKSLASRRLFQRAVTDVIDDPSLPFPIFFEAREIREPIRYLIVERCLGNVEPHQQPVLVVVDGIDELGSNDATRLLRDLAIYSDANPKASILTTARPLPGLYRPPSIVKIPELDTDQAAQLIQRIVGDDMGPFNLAHWRYSVREAANYPCSPS